VGTTECEDRTGSSFREVVRELPQASAVGEPRVNGLSIERVLVILILVIIVVWLIEKVT